MNTGTLLLLAAITVTAVQAQTSTKPTATKASRPAPAYTDPRLVAITNQLRAIPAERVAAEAACLKAGIPKQTVKNGAAHTSGKNALLDKLRAVDAKEASLLAQATAIRAQRAKFGHRP